MRDQAAVVGVEPDHVGDGAERNQRQQRVELGLTCAAEHAAFPQLGAQRQQHVEHHADASHGLAFEVAAGLVGVDDHVGVRQHHLPALQRGQVVVGHQHLHAQLFGARHAVQAGDAVIDGDQKVATDRFDALGNRRGQAVAIDDAVGHQITNSRGTEQAQAAQRDGAGGGTVAVVVGDDADSPVCCDGVGQHHGGFRRAA